MASVRTQDRTHVSAYVRSYVRRLFSASFVAFLAGFLAAYSLLSSPLANANEADFPLPQSLVPAVNFWVKVYTLADTESGFLHDNVNLDVVYEKLPRDKQLIDEHRAQIIQDLHVLASGKRSELTERQQQILTLWGKDVSNETLQVATKNVRWQLGQSDRYLEGLRRSGAYVPHIRAVARSMGLPEELAALPHVESSFHPGASSSVAATGMFQFMRETGKRFMRVDTLVDERLDPYKSAYAALRLLKENYEDLGTWPLALTAYNHGTNGMLKAVREAGTKNIGEIVENYKGPRFGFASRNFYAQFLATRQVEKNSDKYFGPLVKQGAPEFAEVKMTGFVDAAVLAKSLGVSLDALKTDNPALADSIWKGSKRIPKDYVVKVDKLSFQGDPTAIMNSIATADFHNNQVQDQTYTVKKGDSLSTIASQYKISVAELVTINQLKSRNAIKVGQKLVLPQQNGAVPTLVVNSSEPRSAIAVGGRYAVQRGDTLSSIAKRFNVPVATLLALNNLRDGNSLKETQQLLLRTETPVPTPMPTQSLTAAVTASNSSPDSSDMQTTDLAGSGQLLSAPLPSQPAGEQEKQLEKQQQTQAMSSMLQNISPADYAVAADDSIVVLPEETLGHYADWLRVSSKDLYSLNKLRSENAVRAGMPLKLDFSRVDRERFAARRQQFHTSLQAQYFNAWRVLEITAYQVQPSDSLAALASTNAIPLWLFRQYNPGVDLSRVQPGQSVAIPKVERLGGN
jgi:membrane-bound lytic murein transglycosylase D